MRIGSLFSGAGGATTYTLTETRGLTLRQYVGRRVRDLRTARHLTQGDLGIRMGRSGCWVCGLETRPGSIGLDTLQRLADALGVAPRELLP